MSIHDVYPPQGEQPATPGAEHPLPGDPLRPAFPGSAGYPAHLPTTGQLHPEAPEQDHQAALPVIRG